jgi:hypothetical protein
MLSVKKQPEITFLTSPFSFNKLLYQSGRAGNQINAFIRYHYCKVECIHASILVGVAGMFIIMRLIYTKMEQKVS